MDSVKHSLGPVDITNITDCGAVVYYTSDSGDYTASVDGGEPLLVCNAVEKCVGGRTSPSVAKLLDTDIAADAYSAATLLDADTLVHQKVQEWLKADAKQYVAIIDAISWHSRKVRLAT